VTAPARRGAANERRHLGVDEALPARTKPRNGTAGRWNR
jgi:hypothetical protein